MNNLIVYIVILLLFSVFVFLLINRNSENKFHLDYILIHTSLLLLSTIIYKGINLNLIGLNFFDLINMLHLASFAYLILHVESAVKGIKSKINWLFFIPVAFYLLIMFLNNFGVYILNYETKKFDFLLIQIIDPIYFSDKLLLKLIAISTLISCLLRFCRSHINSSVTIKKNRLYKIWIYSYLFILLETLFLNCSYYFSILNPVFDSKIYVIARINVISSLLFFIANPVLLKYLPFIKKIDIIEPAIHKVTFIMVTNLFQNECYYLKRRLTIDDIVSAIGSSKRKVQKAIFSNTQLNFNDFVNSYRIEKSIELINKDYLIKMNLKSLAKASGFNSHQTFFRAFKKIKGCTPTEYRKQIFK